MSRVFALADTHLSGVVDKPMDVFGPAWERHAERHRRSSGPAYGGRRTTVVLVPGDISWAHASSTRRAPTCEFLAALPGRHKLLLKGNHDYWWTSRSQGRRRSFRRRHVPPAERLPSISAAGVGVVGTRGWSPPSSPHAKPEDEKIFKRELGRLEMSLKAAAGRFDRTIAMLHYPPTYRGFGDTEFAGLLEEAGVDICVYGHLHGADHRLAVQGVHRTIRYVFVAADAVDFTPVDLDVELSG